MPDVMLDARQEGDSYRRIEVITAQRRGRRRTAQEKARIVAESFEEGANISELARRNGVVRGLLTVWRHKLAAASGANAGGFVPVRIASDGSRAKTGELDRVALAHRRLQELAPPPGQFRGIIRDRGERGAHPGRARGRSDDAFDSASGAPRRPMFAVRVDLKVMMTAHPVSQVRAHAVGAGERGGARERAPLQARGQIEASGVGRQRHGAADEAAGERPLHLAIADRRPGFDLGGAIDLHARRHRLAQSASYFSPGNCRIIIRNLRVKNLDL
jgi:transposase